MPATHIWYDTKGAKNISGFRVELVACKGKDPVNTYYMACGFSRGYLGMQVNSEVERRILFSVWDDGKGGKVEMLQKSDDVLVKPFGGEGEGIQSIFKYNWETGVPQRFQVMAKPEGNTTIYSGYFWLNNEWKLLSSLRAPSDGKYLSGLYSFLENFGPCTDDERRCVYRDQSMQLDDGSNKWIDLKQCNCTYTAGDGPLEFGNEDEGFFMSIDGKHKQFSPNNPKVLKR